MKLPLAIQFASPFQVLRLSVACCAIGCWAANSRAQSLDDQLFQDLREPAVSQTRSADDASREQDDQQLLRELGGEDIGQGPQSPLADAVEAMRNVKNRLAAKDTSGATREIQQSIVMDFDRLIAQLEQKQQQKKSSGGQQKQQTKQRSSSTPKPKQPQEASSDPANRSNQSAKQSQTKLTQADAVRTSPASRDRMLQESWGNLPAGVRQQMQSARPEKFLPKYEQLIEEYFRRLSQEEDE